MFLTGKRLSRRAVLKGMGATIALPFLDAMPAVAKSPLRLICIEQVHGAAGSSIYGAQQNLWAPAATGRTYDLSTVEPQAARAVARSPHDHQQHRRAERRSDRSARDRRRSLPLERDVSHAARSEAHRGPDVEGGVSMDQLYAQRFGQDTPIPSMQLCIETVDQPAAAGYGYSCLYIDTLSWSTPTTPLPMIRDPRVRLRSDVRRARRRGVAGRAARAAAGGSAASSTGCVSSSKRLERSLGAERSRAPGRLPRQRPRDRAAASARREPQPQRRRPRAADGAPGRARLVRRSRQADVRPADAGVPHRTSRACSRSSSAATARTASTTTAARPARSTSSRTTPRIRSACGSSPTSTNTMSHAAVSAEAAERNAGRRRLDAG